MNSEKNVFPKQPSVAHSTFPIPDNGDNGITLREYAAVHIMAGIAANPNAGEIKDEATVAVIAADALLARLAEGSET